MKSTKTLMSLLLALLVGPAAASDRPDPVQAWWGSVSALCGKAFPGRLEMAPEGDTGFVGKALMMHVRDCTAERIRIPFMVGDNRSRTWVLTRHGDRIELKHDHRHRTDRRTRSPGTVAPVPTPAAPTGRCSRPTMTPDACCPAAACAASG